MSINFRTAAMGSLAGLHAKLRPWLAIVFTWIVEKTPIVGMAYVRRRRRIVIGPYKRTHTLFGSLIGILGAPILLVGCLIYGFFFGLTAPYLLVPFVIPIALIAGINIWALPDQRTAPTRPIEFLFPAYFVFHVLWPNYVALAIPGLPWITILRIIGLPMAAFFLVSLSVSKPFRRQTYESVSSIKPLWICTVGFSIVQILTLFFSKAPFASAQSVFDQHIDFTLVFIIGCIIFRKDKMVERYFALLCMLSVAMVLLTVVESHRRHILWAGHIPPILQIHAPSVQLTLTPAFRLYTNLYRAKATFSTPLALAEYISLLTPLFIYFGLSKIGWLWRVGSFLMIPLTFLAVRMTDARLGIVGIFSSVLLYGLLASIVRWRSRPRDLLAAATVYAYPAIFVVAMGVIFSSHRLKTMVFGGEAQAGSTLARTSQLQMAADKFWSHPWGYGAGQSGLAMGFAKDAFITIDNFFISVELDYGLLGIIFWYGMFVIGIVAAVIHCVMDKYASKPEARLLAPLAVSLTAFLIVKWVHGQDENHSVYFLMLAMVSALIYRMRHETPPQKSTGVASSAPPVWIEN